MKQGDLLITGVGGLGCIWAQNAHSRCPRLADLLLIDADEHSFLSSAEAHCLHLDAAGDGRGAAALPLLAAHRLRDGLDSIRPLLEAAEMIVILTGLGGGVGSGVASEIAKIAQSTNCLVVSVASLPFAEQPVRMQLAKDAMEELDKNSHVCIRISLERLAWQAKQRALEWQSGAGWIEELVEGLVSTLARVGKINLDLMDLRSVVGHEGNATLIVGTGTTRNPKGVVQIARESPLYDLNIDGASGCLIQVEGGADMTLSHLNEVTDEFVSNLSPNCQVIMGARVGEGLIGKLRITAVVSGL